MVISSFRTVHNTSRMIWLMSTNFIEVIVVKFYRHELCNSFCWLCHPSISIHPFVRSFIAPPESVSLCHKVYTNPYQCWSYQFKFLVHLAVNSLSCVGVRAPWVNICRTVCSINAIKCREISCGNIIVRLSLFVYFVCIVIVDCW